MQIAGIIICFGGGGFTNDVDPALEDGCLALLPARPKLGYIGWANGNDPARVARFHARFGAVAGATSHLGVETDQTTLAAWLADQDMVYFAGGDTARLLAILRRDERAALFGAANAAGCLLAGVSAGGVCWFDWILSDTDGHSPAPIDGLGMIKAGICPHYDTEPGRHDPFAHAVAARGPLPAYAVDDGAGIVTRGGEVLGQISARTTAAAYEVHHSAAGSITHRTLARFMPTGR